MGNYLQSPKTDKISTVEVCPQNHWGCSASIMQGWRSSQEDAYDVNLDFIDGSLFFAVYDGHGGSAVCNYVKKMLPNFIKANWNSDNIPQTLKKAFFDLDATLLSSSVQKEIKDMYDKEKIHSGGVTKDDLLSEAKAILGSYSDEEDEQSNSDEEDEQSNSDEEDEQTNSDKEDEQINSNANDDNSSSKEIDDVDEKSENSRESKQEKKKSNKNEDEDENVSLEENSKCHFKADDIKATLKEEKDPQDKLENSENASLVPPTTLLNYDPIYDSGSTASVVIIYKNIIYCANVGDSYCYLYENNAFISLCTEVTPESKSEKFRIENAGGSVSADGRINGQINLSRALGDFNFKNNEALSAEEQMISPMPFVKSLPVTKDFQFIILASDGIWNSSLHAFDFLKTKFSNCANFHQLSELVENLLDECIEEELSCDGTGCDNMTAILVSTQSVMKENGPPASKKRRINLESAFK